jgi:ribonucleotide reductase beta subunit family protein with ferritin-like domain
MDALAQTRKWWYALMLGISLQVDLYMTHEYKAFVANVMVTNLTWETMATNVISQPASAIAEFSAIVKIYKYRRFHDKHHLF